MRLVDDAKSAWKWFSVQAMALACALQGTWALIPDDLKQNVPHWLITAITMLILAAGVAGRLMRQDHQ